MPQARQTGYQVYLLGSGYTNPQQIPNLFMGRHLGDDSAPPAHRLSPATSTYEQNWTLRTSSQLADMATAVQEEIKKRVITGGDELTLNSTASQEDRCLFDLYRRYKHIRGQGMWKAICAEYSVNIYQQEEKNKYTRYAALLRESIGNEDYGFTAADVEAFIVRIGFEDPIPDTKLRRRHRNNLRRGKTYHMQQAPVSKIRPASNGFATAPLAGQAQQLPSPTGPIPIFTSEQEKAFVKSLEEKYGDAEPGDALESKYSHSTARVY
ncbi:hypothetical protein SEUCBS140593_009177 [Sporothrix eucalyptigena]|uniref:Uncharacterized protein n=1 Tax=Sporothrix eucalyptigena TaxID=1812306 RepID=A0ABP0CUZ8_9PEZI